jgi:SAM-dependent methyltransferase
MTDKERWVEESRCPACGSKKITIHGSFGYIPVVRIPDVVYGCPMAMMTSYSDCDECGLIFQNPHLDAEAVTEYYATGTYRKLLNVRNAEDMDADEARGQNEWAEFIPGNGRHLDIGCSRGAMLQLTQMKGCEVMGVEPNLSYVGMGIPVKASLYEVEGQWTYITCKHVLEHVPDLRKFVDKIIELLEPGGRLFLEVPAEGSPGAELRLPHLYLFNEKVIRDLFKSLEVESYDADPHHFFVMRKAE